MRPRKKMAMWLKIGMILCVSAAVFFIISISIEYIAGFLSIRQAVGTSQSEMASLMSSDLTAMLVSRIDALELVTSGAAAVKKAITDNNLKYQGLSGPDIKRNLSDAKKKWLEPGGDQAFKKAYLENGAVDEMRLILSGRAELVGISAIDKFGSLVASSDNSAYFYYADEEWWKKALAGGKGSVIIGDPEMAL